MKSMETHRSPARGGRMRIPRSRGAASGFLLLILGLWGALIPFVGPYFDFAFSPDQGWVWTIGRGWLEVLPGAATALGGLLLLISGNRATAMFGGWLTVLAGAWFVVGRGLAEPLRMGDVGSPVATTEIKRIWLELAYFDGLGALIIFLGALALGRLSVRTLRDIRYAERPFAEPTTGPLPTTGISRHSTLEPETVGPRPAHRPDAIATTTAAPLPANASHREVETPRTADANAADAPRTPVGTARTADAPSATDPSVSRAATDGTATEETARPRDAAVAPAGPAGRKSWRDTLNRRWGDLVHRRQARREELSGTNTTGR